MKVSISDAAKFYGVSKDTLRRWEKIGKLIPEKTLKGHRRYDINKTANNLNKKIICYARVSTSGQKEDLNRQICLLETFCAAKGFSFEVIKDIGSGLNYNKQGFKKLLNLISTDQLDKLLVVTKDRLLRFGSEIIFQLCQDKNIEVIEINKSEDETFEQELVNDILEIITVFSAKLYGKRSHKNKRILNQIKKEIESNEKE